MRRQGSAPVRVVAMNRPDVPPIDMPHSFRTEITYFMTPAGEEGVPPLASPEYWVRLSDARRWLEDLVVEVISPLAAHMKAEVEISEVQERWLEWMVRHEVQHIRLEETIAGRP